MPYNNTAIPPPEEITGQAALPLARIKRIIHTDEHVQNCASNSAFLISVATEMFVQYLAEQGQNVVKSERKPRKNIQYKDLANAVARIDNLEFLSDVIPRTVPYKQLVKESKKAKEGGQGSVERGQTTLDGRKRDENGFGGDSARDQDGAEEDEAAALQLMGQPMDMEIRGGRSNGIPRKSGDHVNGGAESDGDSTMD